VFFMSLSTPFLMEIGFAKSEIAYITKVYGMLASILGVFCGGVIIYRIGLWRSLLIFAVLQGVTNLPYLLLLQTGKNIPLASVSYFLESLCSGMGTAAFLAFLTGLCNKKFSASQFALFSALDSLCRPFAGKISPIIVGKFGWGDFYIFTAIIAIPGILLVCYLKQNLIILNNDNVELDTSASTPDDPVAKYN
jgi:PAT family beta-lactamase induction signal transducer AmpG